MLCGDLNGKEIQKRSQRQRGRGLLPGWLRGKESSFSAADAGDVDSIPGSGRSVGGGHSNPLQYFCLENPRDPGSWQAHSPWILKESDMTEVT